MKRLITIVLVMLTALMFSGCVIVDAHYHRRHRYHGGVVVTNYPPEPVCVIRTSPPPPHPVVIVESSHPRPGRPHHKSRPYHSGRRNLRK
jgi:hypothetical protein